MSTTDIENYRADTPACAEVLHLNNAGAALQPTVVQTAIQEHLALEYQLGGYEAATIHQAKSAAFYTSVARLLNAQADEIAFATSATNAYNHALTAIPFRAGDLILTTENDYVSNHIAFLQARDIYGIQIRCAPESPAGGVDVAAMQALIHELRPRLVAVTHMPTSSGLIQDVVAIGQTCAEYDDCWYLVDACQTAGQLPLDVRTIQCDFLSATLRKYLRGPRGTGFLYVSARALTAGLTPQYLDLHSADWTAADDYRPKDNAQRFELWERNHALVHGAVAAIDYALAVGLAPIAARTAELAQQLRQQLQTIPGIQVLDRGERLGAIVTCYAPDCEPTALLAALRAERVHGSISWNAYARYDLDQKGVPWVLRLSPHYYNTIEEIATATKKIFKIIC